MKSNYLNDINNFSEETKKEFLIIVKASFTTFFNQIELAIKDNDTDTILKLVHKEYPTLIMLELKSAQHFFYQLKNTTINSNNVSDILDKLNHEKNQIIKKGWM